MANFLGQLAVLSGVLYNFPLVGFSSQEFLLFTSAWLLSDLAVAICLFELGISTGKLKEIPPSQLNVKEKLPKKLKKKNLAFYH